MNKILDRLIEIICSNHNLTENTLFSRCRLPEIVKPRQYFHFLARKYTNVSLKNIGSYNKGLLNHATVLSSCKTIQNLIDTNDISIVKDIREIENKLFIAYPYLRVSKEKLANILNRAKKGDIVAFKTDKWQVGKIITLLQPHSLFNSKNIHFVTIVNEKGCFYYDDIKDLKILE